MTLNGKKHQVCARRVGAPAISIKVCNCIVKNCVYPILQSPEIIAHIGWHTKETRSRICWVYPHNKEILNFLGLWKGGCSNISQIRVPERWFAACQRSQLNPFVVELSALAVKLYVKMINFYRVGNHLVGFLANAAVHYFNYINYFNSLVFL